MDPSAFNALVERCAPGLSVEPLAAIVERASDFEPLAIGAGKTRSIAIQATSRSEAVTLATELVIAGYRVRIGLAQIDTRDLTRLGLSVADGFEPCIHVKAAARLLAESPAKLKIDQLPAKGPISAGRATGHDTRTDEPAPAHDERSASTWDVYAQSRGSSAIVYGGAQRVKR